MKTKKGIKQTERICRKSRKTDDAFSNWWYNSTRYGGENRIGVRL